MDYPEKAGCHDDSDDDVLKGHIIQKSVFRPGKP